MVVLVQPFLLELGVEDPIRVFVMGVSGGSEAGLDFVGLIFGGVGVAEFVVELLRNAGDEILYFLGHGLVIFLLVGSWHP